MTNYITKTIKNGVEANIPVTSVNGQYGDVEFNAGEGIQIGTYNDYSAMQGPAPDGFHVPLNTEWQAVYNIWKALGGGSSDGTNFGIALKLPFSGSRKPSDATNTSYTYYWSATPYYSGNQGVYVLYIASSSVYVTDINMSNACSIRGFKNTSVIPTNAWTKLYGTSIEAGGIFWSAADGLISLSSDGTTWITIADKNLGATTVWNSGDTLSESNCGKLFQWGNNYGFPRTGTITNKSKTRVDTTGYGPGNYYYSETFINNQAGWHTDNNMNLRGGDTGVITYDNAITNTGVLSVNGQTGDVTTATVMTTSEYGQVSNPIAGKIYFIKES